MTAPTIWCVGVRATAFGLARHYRPLAVGALGRGRLVLYLARRGWFSTSSLASCARARCVGSRMLLEDRKHALA